MCLNRKVLIGLGAVALIVLALSPRTLVSAAPLLVFAICPLSMVFMMRAMSGRNASGVADTKPPLNDPAASPAADTPQLRELAEEVNRLKAELHIRDQQRSS